VKSAAEYAAIMNGLNLPSPKMMDVAVPSNRAIGLAQQKGITEGWGVPAAQAVADASRPDVLVVDLREGRERFHDADIPSSVHAPYAALEQFLRPGGLLNYEGTRGAKRLLF